MIPDIAHGQVRDNLRDENIRDLYQGHVLDQLLKLPEAWRQNALAEYNKRTCYTSYVRSDGVSEPILLSRPGVDAILELRRIVNEILIQIGAPA